MFDKYKEPCKYKYMEKVKSRIRSLGKKKIIILAIGIGMFAIILIFYVAIQPNPPASGILTPTPSYIPQQNGKMSDKNMHPTNAVVTVASQNAIPKWKNYAGSSYTMAVPPDWSVYPNQAVNGGEVVIVRPDILPTGVSSPEFIFYSNLNASTMQQKTSVLKALGFKESTITILGKSASKFSGTLSSKMIGDQRVNQSIQITDIYLTQGDKLYVFTYQYDGATPSKLLEDYFIDIIDTIRLK
jgi:hypothetical protein